MSSFVLKGPVNREDFPLVMDARDLQQIFHSRTMVYQLMNRDGFPILQIGRRKYINRDAFFVWLDTHTQGMQITV